jgi:SpoIID/LytB domain protein
MSQYGAYGMAKAGRTYDEILRYYYTGVDLGKVGKTNVRVLLAEGRRAVTVSSTSAFSARDASGAVYRLKAGAIDLRTDLSLSTEDGSEPIVQPLVIRAGKALLSLDGKTYRGTLQITMQGGYLRVVNVVGLDPYLQGVVPGEMPHSWPGEALRAQAVAARSYALASLVKGKLYDLYADVRSQVYLGVAGERPSTTDAVRSTSGAVVLYEGKVASTLYFSTSGGRTASASDVFGTDVPYLVSRPDPWDSASPYHRWGPVLVGARTIQSKLGIDDRVLDAVGTATPSRRLRSLVVQTTTGSETVPASLVRTALGLRSTWITIGVLRLDRPSGQIVFGTEVRISGLSRGLTSPTLASSPDGVAWTKTSALTREGGAVVAAVVTPARTMRYRLEVAGAASPAQLVQVAPLVQLVRGTDPAELSGAVRPKLPGARVTIERKTGTTWKRVKRVIVDADGAFSAKLTLVPGSYRATVAATGELVAGTSGSLQVGG